MASSSAKTVAAYLKELPAERRAVVKKVRDAVNENMPDGYEEGMLWGMITWTVPKKRLAETYNGQPLCYAGLAAQKNSYSLYLMSVAGGDAFARKFEAAYKATGKKLDKGKSCIRFRDADDLPLDVIGSTIASVPVDDWINIYHASRAKTKTGARKKTS